MQSLRGKSEPRTSCLYNKHVTADSFLQPLCGLKIMLPEQAYEVSILSPVHVDEDVENQRREHVA